MLPMKDFYNEYSNQMYDEYSSYNSKNNNNYMINLYKYKKIF